MSAKLLSGAQKAAILLLSLGEDLASSLVSKLDPSEAKKILLHLSQMQRVDDQTSQQVIEDFQKNLGVNKGIKGSREAAKGIISRAFSGDSATDLSNFIDENSAEITALEGIDSNTVYRVLKNELPQTLALILSHIDAIQSAEIICLFPEIMQTDIIMRISKLETVNPIMIDEINEQLKQELSSEYISSSEKLGGDKKVAAILNAMQSGGDEILDSLNDIDPDKADKIREHMATFEDLCFLDREEFLSLFKEINYKTWVLAGRGYSEEVKEFFKQNLSTSRYQMFMEDIDDQGKMAFSSVKEAEKEILMKALDLHDSGIINLKKSNEKWVI
jgi:flagellar motor switch protein FliG